MSLQNVLRKKLILREFVLVFLSLFVIASSARAQTAQSETLVVTGEEVPSAYGATPGFSRSRFSNLTTAYVLPPGAVLAALIYQGD
jgi:hypothetical protein